MQKLNKMFEEYKIGKISFKEFKQITYEKVFKDRTFFSLQTLNDDEFSDFFLYFYPRLDSIIKNFDPRLSLFSSYLYRCVNYLNRAWYNTQKHKKAKDRSIIQYAFEECYDQICAQEEPSYYVNENRNQYKNFYSQPTKLTDKQKIMIMALKSCHFLTGNQIHAICKEFNIDEQHFSELLQKANDSIKNKVEIFNSRKRKMNTLYIAKKEILDKISYSAHDDYSVKHLLKRYNYLNTLWVKKLAETHNSSIRPSNEKISELLRINTYNIHRVLEEARKVFIENS